MKKMRILLLALLGLTFVFTSCDNGDENIQYKEAYPMNKKHDDALLLVTFGSTWEMPHNTYKTIYSAYKKAYPNKDIYMSFTSRKCITRWGAREKELYLPPEIWLEKLAEEGYKRITVQSLHCIPGEEFMNLRDDFVGGFIEENKEKNRDIQVVLGTPLLNTQEDIKKVANALMNEFKDKFAKGEAFVFMGHGNPEDGYIKGIVDEDGNIIRNGKGGKTVGIKDENGNIKPNGVNQSYFDIQRDMRAFDNGKYTDKIFVGTVDYEPMFAENVLPQMKGKVAEGTVVNLLPLMSIAGDHANNDMASTKDGWRASVMAMGYKVEDSNVILKGLADFPEILKVWMEHTAEAEKQLK